VVVGGEGIWEEGGIIARKRVCKVLQVACGEVVLAWQRVGSAERGYR